MTVLVKILTFTKVVGEKKKIISKKISMFLLFEQIGLYNFIDYFSFFFSFVFALDTSLSDTISNGYKLVGFDN